MSRFLWPSEVPAPAPSVDCIAVHFLRRGAAARHSSFLLVPSDHCSFADPAHGRVARTSMIHATSPHFLWPFAVQYAAHQLNLWHRVSERETLPTLRWTGEVGDASTFRVWGSLRNTTADKLSSCTVRCVVLGFPTNAPCWQFCHPATHRILSSQDVTFDKSVCYYRLLPHVSSPVPPPPLVPGYPLIDPHPPLSHVSSGVSRVIPPPLVEPLEVSSGPAEGVDPAADDIAASRCSPRLETPPGFPPRPSSPPLQPIAEESSAARGGDAGGVGSEGADARDAGSLGAGPGGAEPGGAAFGGGQLLPSRLHVNLSPQKLHDWVLERCADSEGAGFGDDEPSVANSGAGGARSIGAGGSGNGGNGAGGPGARGTRAVGNGVGGTGGSSAEDAAQPVQRRPFFLPLPKSSLPPPGLALHQVLRLLSSIDLIPPVLCPPPDQSQPQFQPESPLPAPSPDTEQTESFTEHREPTSCPASPVCTVRRVRRVCPPPVPGTHTMAIRPSSTPKRVPLPSPLASSISDGRDPRVKRLLSSLPAFLACYVAPGFSQRQGVDFFHTFSPTPKMSTLRAPREWHDTLRTTLTALGLAPLTTDPSLFLHIDPSLLPFYILVNVDNLVFATADTASLVFMKTTCFFCIKDLWQLPIICWSGKLPATAAAAATAKATAGGEETAPSDGALDAVKKVQQPQQPHGEVLAGVDATAAWAKASSGSGEADWENWHERLESGHRVKVIRTDNGVEFIGADFEAVLKKKGIQHQLTVPYNPQQNGMAECFNRTLQEGARTLLGRAGLPDPFWVTALRQVVLVKNRVLATMGDKKWVPYTKWYGSAPTVNMLRAYCCMVVFHVPKEKRGKLEASGRWGVHLGLAKDHKGWLIWDLTSQQLTVSRDVKFFESLYYKEWKQQQQKLPTTLLIIEADEVQRPSRQVQHLTAARASVARVVAVAEGVVVVGAVEAVEVVAAVGVVAGAGASVVPVVVAVGVGVVVVAAVGVVEAAVAAVGVELLRGERTRLRSGASGGSVYPMPPDPGIEAASLGTSESALSGTASAEALHTFTLDSGASCCFFCDCTILTPLPTPVPVRLVDPSGGPVLARSSTVLPCPAVLFGSLSGLHLPSFSTNLMSTDAMVTTTTLGGQRVSICTCTRTGRHLATFTRRTGSSLYILTTKPPQVAASAQVSASGPLAAPCSCRLISHQTLLWHHRLGHPTLPRLRGMHSRPLVSGLPRSLPPLPPSPALPCLPCVEGWQRVAPHSSSFPPTTAPLQTLHMDVWGPARVSGQGRERYTTVFPLRSKCEDLPVLHLHSDRGGEFSSDLLRDF
ncbi:unnamed protein product, partial [Closterium sp. NIES-53]